MKKIIISIFIFCLLLPTDAIAYVSVKGYYRSNGTYVAPHVRSNPNGLKSDNYGYKPSQGVYNSSYGTRGASWDTPTTITDPDYYLGKSIYDNSNSSYEKNTKLPSIDSYYDSYTYTSTPTNNSYLGSYQRVTLPVISPSPKDQMFVPYVVKYWAVAIP